MTLLYINWIHCPSCILLLFLILLWVLTIFINRVKLNLFRLKEFALLFVILNKLIHVFLMQIFTQDILYSVTISLKSCVSVLVSVPRSCCIPVTLYKTNSFLVLCLTITACREVAKNNKQVSQISTEKC